MVVDVIVGSVVLLDENGIERVIGCLIKVLIVYLSGVIGKRWCLMPIVFNE